MSEDHAAVIARPPLIYLTSIASAIALDLLWPLGFAPASLRWALGPVLVMASLGLLFLAMREFRRAGTSVPTYEPTTAIAATGPYRFSRNPIYLAFTLLQCGLAVWLDNLWLALVLVPTLALVSRGVIDREERYLERKFGEDYVAYRNSVRRWI